MTFMLTLFIVYRETICLPVTHICLCGWQFFLIWWKDAGNHYAINWQKHRNHV